MTNDQTELVQAAQPSVSERRLARVYGEALLNTAEEQQAAAEVLGQLHDLDIDMRQRDPYVRAFFTSGVIGKIRRESAIRGAFENRVHPLVLNFLLVLNDHERLELFRTAIEEIQKLNDLRQRHFRVRVDSVLPLETDQRQKLIEDLRHSFRLEPVLDERTNPGLLGGMVMRVGDWVFDGSVRTQLLNLRKQLREMSSHEIQSGRDRFSTAEGD